MSADFEAAFAQLGDMLSAQKDRVSGEQPAVPSGLSVSVSSDDSAIDVTVTDDVVSGLTINEAWLAASTHAQVERQIAATVTKAYEAYREAALAEYRRISPDFDRLQEIVRDSQEKLRTAFGKTMAGAVDEAELNAQRLREQQPWPT